MSSTRIFHIIRPNNILALQHQFLLQCTQNGKIMKVVWEKARRVRERQGRGWERRLGARKQIQNLNEGEINWASLWCVLVSRGTKDKVEFEVCRTNSYKVLLVRTVLRTYSASCLLPSSDPWKDKYVGQPSPSRKNQKTNLKSSNDSAYQGRKCGQRR